MTKTELLLHSHLSSLFSPVRSQSYSVSPPFTQLLSPKYLDLLLGSPFPTKLRVVELSPSGVQLIRAEEIASGSVVFFGSLS